MRAKIGRVVLRGVKPPKHEHAPTLAEQAMVENTSNDENTMAAR